MSQNQFHSAFTYMDAKNLSEFHSEITFVGDMVFRFMLELGERDDLPFSIATDGCALATARTASLMLLEDGERQITEAEFEAIVDDFRLTLLKTFRSDHPDCLSEEMQGRIEMLDQAMKRKRGLPNTGGLQ